MSQLALNGGEPVITRIFPAWPQFCNADADALQRVFHSGVWGVGGKDTTLFETEFAEYIGARHALTTTNGTVSLEIALRAFGLGYGDEVITTPYTFYATASSVMAVGAVPVFVDIDPRTYNIDPNLIEAAVTERTRAIIPVHIGGRPCDMDAIGDIADKRGLLVLEDAAHAHGAEWKGRRVGALRDAGSFSFQSSKALSAGEGGCIVTNNDEVALRCWSVLNGGRLPDREWYEHFSISTNGRLSQFQAAVLRRQLLRLDHQIELRSRNADELRAALAEHDFISVREPDGRITRNTHHFFVLRYSAAVCRGVPRERFIEALRAEGVPAFSGYRCLYKQPVFGSPDMIRRTGARLRYADLHLPHVEAATERESVWIPQAVLHGTPEDMQAISRAIGKIYAAADELR